MQQRRRHQLDHPVLADKAVVRSLRLARIRVDDLSFHFGGHLGAWLLPRLGSAGTRTARGARSGEWRGVGSRVVSRETNHCSQWTSASLRRLGIACLSSVLDSLVLLTRSTVEPPAENGRPFSPCSIDLPCEFWRNSTPVPTALLTGKQAPGQGLRAPEQGVWALGQGCGTMRRRTRVAAPSSQLLHPAGESGDPATRHCDRCQQLFTRWQPTTAGRRTAPQRAKAENTCASIMSLQNVNCFNFLEICARPET